MEHTTQPQWLTWARQLQATAQTGLTYAKDPFDIERYTAMRELAAQIVAQHAGADVGEVRELFAGQVGHATPKVDVRGVVFRDESILLVRERSDGRWTLPGGWADPGEGPSVAAVREVYEESGFRTRAVKLLAVYNRSQHDHPPLMFEVYKLFFLCEIVGGMATESLETSGVGFFREAALPELSRGRVTPKQIARFFAHRRHPEWPTDFD